MMVTEENFWWKPKHTEGATVRFNNLQEADDFCSEHFLCFECYLKEDDDGYYIVYPTLSVMVQRENEFYGNNES